MGGNPHPSVGFHTHPERINRVGNIKTKGYSITRMMQEMLSSMPEAREAIGKAIIKKALEGDIAAQKLVWNYMDGMPPQTIRGEQNNPIIFHVRIEPIVRH